MRALIPITTKQSVTDKEEELKAIAETNLWLVREASKARQILDAVLQDSASRDNAEIESEYLFALELLDHQIFGVLGLAGSHLIKLRLLGTQDVDILKQACEEIIAALKRHDEAARRQRGTTFGFEFNSKVLIRAKEHNEIIARGFIPQESALKHAWELEHFQGLVAKWGLAIFLWCSLVTYPSVAHGLFDSLFLNREDLDWFIGILGRIGTTAIFAAIVAYLNIHQLAQRFKQSGGIVW